MKNYICPVVGIHTSGKSEMTRLVRSLGYTALPEIAQELFIDKGVKLANIAGEELQKAIMNSELERDAKVYGQILAGNGPIFIETWHIGNLAHSKIVAPKLYREYQRIFGNIVRKNRIHIFYLDLKPEEIEKRSKLHDVKIEPRIIEFHKQVKDNIELLLNEFELSFTTINAGVNLKLVKQQFIRELETLFK